MPTVPAETDRFERFAVLGLALVGLVCAVLHWKELDSLLNGNTSKWLGEVLRFSRGEMPYRDFSWPYPPFALFLLGYAARAFGASFVTVMIVIDVLGMGVVALTYLLLRQLTNWRFAAAITAAILIVYGLEGNIEPLFSLQIYSPAILTGSIGILVLLIGLLRRAPKVWLVAVGAFVAMMSKPEFAAATVAALALATLTRWRGLRSLVLPAAGLVPAMLAYALVYVSLGRADVVLCLSGLGLTRIACSWWPTGLGLFSVIAALACSVLLLLPVMGFSALIVKRNPGLPLRSLMLWTLFAVVTLSRYLPWYFAGIANINRNIYLTWFVTTNSLFTLIVWPLGVMLLVMLVKFLLGRGGCGDESMMILCAVPFAMQMRSLFATILFVPRPVTETPVAACLFAVICGAVVVAALLERQFRGALTRGQVQTAVAAGALTLAVLVAAGAAWTHHRKPAFATVATPAGSLRVRDADPTARVIEFVLAHSAPGDSIQEIPLGGGISFATGRMARAYTTQFTSVAPPAYVLERDERILREHPPALVIGMKERQFGAFYGMNARVGCTFPELVWMPQMLAGDAALEFPAIRYLAANYTLAEQSGDYVMLLPKR